MIFFAGGRPTGNQAPPDANPGHFIRRSATLIRNWSRNPGAVAVRAHFAQHCFLAHIDFHIGSGLAGIHDGGNVRQDVRFYGAVRHMDLQTSPGWQFTIVVDAGKSRTNMKIDVGQETVLCEVRSYRNPRPDFLLQFRNQCC